MGKPEIHYYYRGRVERGTRYEWRDAYSENSAEGLPLYPWSTKRECQAEARARGARAIFHRAAGLLNQDAVDLYLKSLPDGGK